MRFTNLFGFGGSSLALYHGSVYAAEHSESC